MIVSRKHSTRERSEGYALAVVVIKQGSKVRKRKSAERREATQPPALIPINYGTAITSALCSKFGDVKVQTVQIRVRYLVLALISTTHPKVTFMTWFFVTKTVTKTAHIFDYWNVKDPGHSIRQHDEDNKSSIVKRNYQEPPK